MSYADPNDWFDPEDDRDQLETLIAWTVIAVIVLFCFGKATHLL